jgi:hypothetical protein
VHLAENTIYWVYYVKWYSESWLILDTIWDRHMLCYTRYIGGWNIVKFIVFASLYIEILDKGYPVSGSVEIITKFER